ncbi:Putative outer membrane iron-siderophore receptor protein [Salinisphaera shabanensis E1L3A]|uniref:Outer membrane iron-siderophore receptor protein n=1 Tax=Salinisphaera shabanensis E1L3A TaxID=1033802 RepID=U2FZZ9_9GAMM|nr:TonB-dependent receptor [Salinisphaera shabanensis]ERJ19658.1 Putative outer membrane iron-siderophore receptor protein [Salinisphaera shabanensis E1L3A]
MIYWGERTTVRRQMRWVGRCAIVWALIYGHVAWAQTTSADNTGTDVLMLGADTTIDANDELDEITVTSASASGYAVDPKNAPASISVIGGEQLQDKSYRDIQQALQDVPGVYLDEGPTGKGGTGEISLRGLAPKYTLLLVDGVPQGSRQAYYNGYGSGAEYSWLPPVSAIERIEVIRGPMSTIYGSDALGGVVNVITKPVADEWAGTITADTIIQQDSASGNRQQGDFSVSGPLIQDTLSLRLNGNILQREEDALEDGYAGYRRRNLDAGLDWAANDANRLSFEAGFGRQDTDASAELTGSDRELRTERERQTLRHSVAWNDHVTTRSYIQHTELTQNDSSYESTYERITANTQTVLPLASQLITLGTQYRKQRSENPDRGLGASDLERYEIAPFVEHEWFMTDDFALTTGLRYVYDENYGDEFVPRMYGVYSLTPQLTLKGGVSAGYRTPDLKEGDSRWIEGGGGPGCPDCRDVGNSDLEPEKSTTYEASLYWQSETGGLASSLTVFRTDFDNKIQKPIVCDTRAGDAACPFASENYTAIYQYSNVDKAKISGVEFTLEAPITQRLSATSSYTYTESEQETGDNAGLPLSDQPKHRATLGLDWDVTGATRLWSQARYKSDTEQVASRRGLSISYPSYTLVDAGVSHQLTDELDIYGGIYNLLDKNIAPENYGRLLDGRRFNVGARLSF